jgi:16S rRNA (cytosine967-C5)-methyltransferase
LYRLLVEAPCPGTGVWRRRPDAKWRVTPEALAKRTAEQDAALARAAKCVKPGGVLVYATCSLLPPENGARVAAFASAHPDFEPIPAAEVWEAALPGIAPPAGVIGATSIILTPRRSGTDGFFVAALRRAA